MNVDEQKHADEVNAVMDKLHSALQGHSSGAGIFALMHMLASTIRAVNDAALRDAMIDTMPRALRDIIAGQIKRRAQHAQDARAPQATSGGQTPAPPAGRGAKN